jgi:hypothetical protein
LLSGINSTQKKPKRRLKGPELVEFSILQRQGLVFKTVLGNVKTLALDFLQNAQGTCMWLYRSFTNLKGYDL